MQILSVLHSLSTKQPWQNINFTIQILTAKRPAKEVSPTFSEMILPFIVSVLSGAAGALGIGGGGVLLLYLTVFEDVDQLRAQGMNLLFFLPTAATALVMHSKNKLIDWRAALTAIPFGLAGAWLGVTLANYIGSDILRKIFGFLLAFTGLKELLASGGRSRNPSKQPE